MYEERDKQDGVPVALAQGVNLATVLQVASSSPTTKSAGSIGIPAPLAGEPGAFSSLLDGLVNRREAALFAGLMEEPPLAVTSSNASLISARAKGKDAKNAENNSTGKKDELKPNLVSVPAGEPPLPIIKPPIIFRATAWETYPQDPPSSEPEADGAANGRSDAAVSSATSSLTATSIPAGKEPAPAARIAFGLQLTAPNRETEAPEGAAPGSKINNSKSEHAEADLPSLISRAGVTADIEQTNTNQADSNRSSPSNSKPVLSVANSGTGPANLPGSVRPPGSDGGDQTAEKAEQAPASWPTRTAARLPVGHGTALPPPTPSADPVKQQDVQESDSDATLAPAPSSSTAPASNLPELLSDPQVAGLQAPDPQKPPEQAGRQNTVPGKASSSTLIDYSDAAPTRIAGADWIASLQPQQGPRSADDSSNGGPVSNGRRDLPDPSGNESRGNSSTPEIQPAGGPATRMGRLGATPLQAPSSRATPASGAPSPAATSEAGKSPTSQPASSQATPLATSSQANSSQPLPGTSVQPVPGPAMLSPAMTHDAIEPPTTSSQTATSAIEPEVNTAPKPPAARQISLQLTGDDSTKVNVDFSERAGKVQVAVRTADPDLTKSMRTDLGDLVERLESKGFKTEAWVPASSRHVPAAAPEQSGSSNGQTNPRHSGSAMGQRQGRQGQNGSNQRQQARWAAQLEQTLSGEETRTTSE